MVIFHSYVNVYQRVNLLIFDVDLVGGIPTPLKNMRKSVGVTISIFFGKKHVPNHQPEIDMYLTSEHIARTLGDIIVICFGYPSFTSSTVRHGSAIVQKHRLRVQPQPEVQAPLLVAHHRHGVPVRKDAGQRVENEVANEPVQDDGVCQPPIYTYRVVPGMFN